MKDTLRTILKEDLKGEYLYLTDQLRLTARNLGAPLVTRAEAFQSAEDVRQYAFNLRDLSDAVSTMQCMHANNLSVMEKRIRELEAALDTAMDALPNQPENAIYKHGIKSLLEEAVPLHDTNNAETTVRRLHHEMRRKYATTDAIGLGVLNEEG